MYSSVVRGIQTWTQLDNTVVPTIIEHVCFSPEETFEKHLLSNYAVWVCLNFEGFESDRLQVSLFFLAGKFGTTQELISNLSRQFFSNQAGPSDRISPKRNKNASKKNTELKFQKLRKNGRQINISTNLPKAVYLSSVSSLLSENANSRHFQHPG